MHVALSLFSGTLGKHIIPLWNELYGYEERNVSKFHFCQSEGKSATFDLSRNNNVILTTAIMLWSNFPGNDDMGSGSASGGGLYIILCGVNLINQGVCG